MRALAEDSNPIRKPAVVVVVVAAVVVVCCCFSYLNTLRRREYSFLR